MSRSRILEMYEVDLIFPLSLEGAEIKDYVWKGLWMFWKGRIEDEEAFQLSSADLT